MNKFDQYLKITMWATSRYYGKEEHKKSLVLSRGSAASKYSKVESLAWGKYITHASELK
jgi:hypothetical protein